MLVVEDDPEMLALVCEHLEGEGYAAVGAGGDEAIPVDLRLMAATNKDLLARIREGLFRTGAGR